MPWISEQARLTQDARLQVASPEEVFKELKEIAQTSEIVGRDDAIEAALIRRNQPLINLALASYGTNKDVFRALYKHSLDAPRDAADAQYKSGLRIGCLSNGSITKAHFVFDFPRELIGEAEINRLLTVGESAEVEALVCNPNVSDELLEELYQHTGLFAATPMKRWRDLIFTSRKNERLGRARDSDDSPDMGHYRIHRAIFQLIETAPVEKDWLRVLYAFFQELNFLHVWNSESIDNALARWAELDDNDHEGKAIEGYFTSLSLKEEFRCLIASLYGRTHANGKFTVQGSPQAGDVARRCAHYGNADQLSEKKLRAGYERDREVFVFAAMNNRNLFSKSALKEMFEEDMISDDLMYRYRKNFELTEKNRTRLFDRVTQTEQNNQMIENLQATVTRIDNRLSAIAEQVRTSQKWIIGVAIFLALILYLKH